MVCWQLACFTFLQLLFVEQANSGAKPESKVKSLLKEILQGKIRYDRTARPITKEQETFVVDKVSFVPGNIDVVNETTQSLKLHGVIRAEWKDKRLIWSNKNKYRDIKQITLSGYRLWNPTFVALNSVSQNSQKSYPISYVVTKDGKVSMYATITAEVGCRIDLTHYPNDEQQCELRLGNPFYSMNELDYDHADKVSDADRLKVAHSPEWSLISTQATRESVPYDLVGSSNKGEDNKDAKDKGTLSRVLVYRLKLKRIHPQVALTAVLPSLLTSSITLIGFWVSDLDLLCMTYMFNLILHGLFLLDFLSDLPPVNDAAPFILQFFSLNLCCTFAAYLANLCMSYLASTTLGSAPVPSLMERIVKLRIWSAVPANRFDLSFSPMVDEEMNEPAPGPKESSSTYSDLFFLVKRLLFVVFTVIYVAFIISYVVVA